MDSVNLMPINLKASKFGEHFDPCNQDFDNVDREKKQKICAESAQKDS